MEETRKIPMPGVHSRTSVEAHRGETHSFDFQTSEWNISQAKVPR